MKESRLTGRELSNPRGSTRLPGAQLFEVRLSPQETEPVVIGDHDEEFHLEAVPSWHSGWRRAGFRHPCLGLGSVPLI